MTTIKQISIPEGQLKLRWREPYVTDGTNKALAALDPGAYRGGYVRATDPISTSFRITADGEDDNFFLWADKTTGTALAVRYGSDVLFDMSARFSGGGGSMPGNETWYVWLDCYYSIGGATTGDFYVGDVVPASANAVQIAKITMPSGATSIIDSYIDISTAYRTVAHVDRPILLAKAVSKTPSTNKFQLTGKVYYPAGSLSWKSPDAYINLTGASGLSRTAYTGDDGAAIWVKKVWADSGLSVAIAADSEGFVVDPWVELDVTQTTDATPPSAYVRYWARGTLRDLVLDDEIKADWLPHDHAAFVATREKAGSPTSLSRGTVQSQIEDLLTAVNARISAQAPESAPASPVLLWRSHNIASDAAVTGTTVSIYWGSNLGFAVIVGGYIDGANAVRALVSPGDQMVLLRLHGNIGAGPELLSSPTAVGATVAWNNAALWTAGLYTANVLGLPVFTMPALIAQILSVTLGLTLDSAVMLLSDHASYISGGQPGVPGRDAFCKLFESTGTDANIRMYYGDQSLWLTFNSSWDQSTSKWYEDTVDHHAIAVGIGVLLIDTHFTVNKKFRQNMGVGGWAVAGWDSAISYGAAIPTEFIGGHWGVLAMPVVAGDYMDICKWCLFSAPDAGGAGRIVYTAVTYHAQVVPNYTSILTPQGSGGTIVSIVVTPDSVDEYGLVIQGVGAYTSPTSYAFGLVTIYDV
jgi:hypothetical protein